MFVHDFTGAQMIAFHGAGNVKKLTSAEAKVFICSGQDINWIGNCMRNPKDRLLIDDSTLRQDVEFLLSIRSCFLTLRYDNDHVVEPYSPHRFSRQFGFCQNIPGALKPDSEEPSLQYLWSLFQTSTQVGTKSSFIIPTTGMNNEIRSRTTAPFKLWWKTSYSSPEPSPSPPLVISSRKRKVDNDNDTKANSSDKGESKLQKSSSQSLREPSPQQGKEGQEKASSQFLDERTIFHDIFGEDEAKLREKQKVCLLVLSHLSLLSLLLLFFLIFLLSLFLHISTLLLQGDQAEDDFDYVKELEIMGNAFAFNNPNAKDMEHTTASIDPNVLVAASDPIAMYASATIIARGSEVVDESPATSMEAPSFNARVMISEADRCAARFLAQQMRAKLPQTPLSNIPALDPELKELFGYIASKNIDVTSLCEHELMKEEEQIKSQQAETLKIKQRCDKLQKELKLLEQKKSELSFALATSGTLSPNMMRL
ncbi:Huntingtin-interacting protein 1-related protein [Bienertia sinuspersici]